MTNIILHDNYPDKKDISIKAEYLNRINTIRGNIINGNKNLLIQWEEILEFTNSKFTESNYQQEMKRKPGRPKINKNKKDNNQMMIENFFQN